jgi:hypothetical protein
MVIEPSHSAGGCESPAGRNSACVAAECGSPDYADRATCVKFFKQNVSAAWQEGPVAAGTDRQDRIPPGFAPESRLVGA